MHAPAYDTRKMHICKHFQSLLLICSTASSLLILHLHAIARIPAIEPSNDSCFLNEPSTFINLFICQRMIEMVGRVITRLGAHHTSIWVHAATRQESAASAWMHRCAHMRKFPEDPLEGKRIKSLTAWTRSSSPRNAPQSTSSM